MKKNDNYYINKYIEIRKKIINDKSKKKFEKKSFDKFINEYNECPQKRFFIPKKIFRWLKWFCYKIENCKNLDKSKLNKKLHFEEFYIFQNFFCSFLMVLKLILNFFEHN